MAERFNLTAQLQLQANTNSVNRTVSNIKKQLAPISNVKMNVQTNARSLAQASKQAKEFNKGLQSSNRSASELNRTLVESARRFSVITIATGSLLSLANAFKKSVKDAIAFEAELVKISQVTGKSVGNLRGLSDEVTRLSTTLGVSSASLLNTSRILLQTGLSADKARKALDVLAKTTLAATFDDIQSTTEGAIALLNQFGAQAAKTGNDIAFLEKSLDAINAVSKNFAVESGDLVSAIRRVGGVFANAGGSVEELVALFTSVRATTRESAETIATGLRTIFTRIQRQDTIDQLKNLGIVLQDAQGNFVGAFEAVQRLSKGLSGLDPRSFRFSSIVEELGGFRQIGKVIPLINQFTVAQQALNVAQNASGSISKDAQTAQQALATEISKTREQFDALIRSFSDSGTFRSIIVGALKLAQAFIKIADSLEPLLPLLTGLFALKAGQGLAAGIGLLRGAGGAARGVQASKFAAGGMVPGTGNRDSVPAMLTPGEFVIRKQSVNKIGASNLAQMNAKGYSKGGGVQYFKNGNRVQPGAGPAGNLTVQDQIGQIVPEGVPGTADSQVRNISVSDLLRKAPELQSRLRNVAPTDTISIAPKKIQVATLDANFSEDKVLKSGMNALDKSVYDAVPRGFKKNVKNVKVSKNSRARETLGGFAFETFAKAVLGASSGNPNDPFDIINSDDKLNKIAKKNPLARFLDAKRTKVRPGEIVDKALRERRVRKTLSLAKKTNRATGGGISGSDTVPAMLTPGEFVFSKSAAQSIGYANLNKMNKQGVTGYAQGGAVGVQHFATGGPTRSGIKQVTNLRTAGLQKDIAATSARMKLYGAEIEKVARQRSVELRQQQQLLSAQARLTQQIAALDKAQLTLKKSAEDGAKGNRALYKIHEMVAKKQEQLNQTTDKLSSVQSQLEKSEKKKLAASDKLAAAEEKRANLISQARNLKQGVTPGLTSGNQTTFNQSGMTYAAKGAAALPAATGGLGTLGKDGQLASTYLKSFGASVQATDSSIRLYEQLIKKGMPAEQALQAATGKLAAETNREAQAATDSVQTKKRLDGTIVRFDSLVKKGTSAENAFIVATRSLSSTEQQAVAAMIKAREETAKNNTIRKKLGNALNEYAAKVKQSGTAMIAGKAAGAVGAAKGFAGQTAAAMAPAAQATQSLQMLAFMGTAMGAAATQALGLGDAMGEAINQSLAMGTTLLFLGSTVLDIAANIGSASVEKAAAAAAAKADLVKVDAAGAAAAADMKKAGVAGGPPGGPGGGASRLAGGLIAAAAAAAVVVTVFQGFAAYWTKTADDLAKKTDASLSKLAESGEGAASSIKQSVGSEIEARNKAASFKTGGKTGAVAGAAAGLAAGAAIGSVIPVVGTLVGAVVGLTVGAIAYKSAQAEAEAAARKEAEAVNAAVDSLVNLSKAQADARNRLQEIANLPLEADQRVDARLSAGVDTAGEASFTSVDAASKQLASFAAKTGKSFDELANITDDDLKKLKGVSESERAIIKLRSKELGQGLKGLQDNLQESRQTLSDAASLELTGDRDFSEIMADPSSRFAQALKQNESLIMLEAQARATQLKQQADSIRANATSVDEINTANDLYAEAANVQSNAIKVAKEQREAYAQVNVKAKEQKDAIALEIAARRAVIAQLKQQQAQLNAIRNMTKGFELAAAGVNDFTANLQGNVAKVEIQDVELGEDLPLGQLAVNLTKFQNTIASLPPQFQRSGQQAAQALLNTRTFIERAGEGLQNLDKEFLGTATADQILGKLNISDSDLFKQLKDTKSVEKFKSDLTDAAKGGIISPDDVDKLFAPFQASAEGYAKEINALAEASRQQLELFRSQTAQEQAVREQNISNLEKYNQVVSAGAERLAKFTGGSAAAARGRAEVQSRQRTLDAGQQSRGGIKLEAGNARQLAAVKKNAEAMLTATRAQIQHARATNADAATIAKLERKQQQLINTTNDAQEALLEMANSTAKFDELTEALDKEIAIREQAYAVLKEFVAGGQSTRDALNQGAAGIMNALRTGTTQNMSEEDRGATFDLLSKLEDVQIGTTGLTGGEVANELVFRDAVRLGFPPDIARQLATQTTTEEQILEELKTQTAIQRENARRGLPAPLGFAEGGSVPGSGNRDSVPAMLTPGEFVINKRASGKLGSAALQHLNKGGTVNYLKNGGFPDYLNDLAKQELDAIVKKAKELYETGNAKAAPLAKQLAPYVKPVAQMLLPYDEKTIAEAYLKTVEGLDPKQMQAISNAIDAEMATLAPVAAYQVNEGRKPVQRDMELFRNIVPDKIKKSGMQVVQARGKGLLGSDTTYRPAGSSLRDYYDILELAAEDTKMSRGYFRKPGDNFPSNVSELFGKNMMGQVMHFPGVQFAFMDLFKKQQGGEQPPKDKEARLARIENDYMDMEQAVKAYSKFDTILTDKIIRYGRSAGQIKSIDRATGNFLEFEDTSLNDKLIDSTLKATQSALNNPMITLRDVLGDGESEVKAVLDILHRNTAQQALQIAKDNAVGPRASGAEKDFQKKKKKASQLSDMFKNMDAKPAPRSRTAPKIPDPTKQQISGFDYDANFPIDDWYSKGEDPNTKKPYKFEGTYHGLASFDPATNQNSIRLKSFTDGKIIEVPIGSLSAESKALASKYYKEEKRRSGYNPTEGLRQELEDINQEWSNYQRARNAMAQAQFDGSSQDIIAAERMQQTSPVKWTDATGKYETVAKYLGHLEDSVVLGKLDGTSISVPIKSLSAESQRLADFLKAQAQEPDPLNDVANIGGMLASGGLVQYRADGGSIFKPRGTDTVPAMLTPGEFVIKKSSVDKIGAGNLSALNSGQAAVVRSNGGAIYRSGGGPVNYLQQGGQGADPINFQNAVTQAGGVNVLDESQYRTLFDNVFRSQVNPNVVVKSVRDNYGLPVAKSLRQALDSGQFDPSRWLPKTKDTISGVLKTMKELNFTVFSSLDATGSRISQDATLGNIKKWTKTWKDQYQRVTGLGTELNVYQDSISGTVLDGLFNGYGSIFQTLRTVKDDFKANGLADSATIADLNAASGAAGGTARTSTDFFQTGDQQQASQRQGPGGRAITALREAGLYLRRGGIAYYNNGGENSADRIPAMLTPGEFVMSPEAVQKYGVGYMKSLNRGVVPGFRRGGMVGSGNVRYRANGSSGPESGGGGTLSVDTSNLQEVLTGFSSSFTESINNVIGTFNTLNTSMTALANAISGGMVITHQFSGDMKMAFNIQNADHLKNAIAEALTPKISDIIRTEIENRLDGDFQAGGG